MKTLIMNKIPTHVWIKDEKIPINTDFRASIEFELLMGDDMVPPEDKVKRALEIYYGKRQFRTEEVGNAVDALLWFYSCGKEQEAETKKNVIVKGHISSTRIYDYQYDADYIYAAFLQQYGIDIETDRIHWWKFKAMFKSLSDQCEFVKIMGYRSIKIDNNMTKSQKEFYQDMKKIHALPLPKSEQQKLSAIEEALLNGKDLSSIMELRNGSG